MKNKIVTEKPIKELQDRINASSYFSELNISLDRLANIFVLLALLFSADAVLFGLTSLDHVEINLLAIGLVTAAFWCGMIGSLHRVSNPTAVLTATLGLLLVVPSPIAEGMSVFQAILTSIF